MGLTIRPASALDLLEAVDDRGEGVCVRARPRFGRLSRQVAEGVALTVRDEAGRLCAVAGLYPDGETEAEAWFAMGPALKANLMPTLRVLRGLFEIIATEAAPLTVRAHLAGVAGAKIARVFGGQPAGVRDTPAGPLDTWTRSFR